MYMSITLHFNDTIVYMYFIGTEEFWVSQECNGEHKSITMMHFHPSERIDEIVEFAIQILTTAEVPSYNVAVKFEGKKVDKSSTAQLYVGKTSRMCPLVLCWGKTSLYFV